MNASTLSGSGVVLGVGDAKTKTFGHRSFPEATASIWIPCPLQFTAQSVDHWFQTALKTHLCKSFYCYCHQKAQKEKVSL